MSTTDYNKVFGNAAIIQISTVVANDVTASSVGSVKDFMNLHRIYSWLQISKGL